MTRGPVLAILAAAGALGFQQPPTPPPPPDIFGGSPQFAGQRFAGRLANDPPGVLTLNERVLVDGTAAQSAMRWEDYTQTAIDPSDDCTIWYVGDYVRKGSTTYSSRIGAFRMPRCEGR